MVGILVSVWDGLFSGGMFVLGSVIGFAFDDVQLFRHLHKLPSLEY